MFTLPQMACSLSSLLLLLFTKPSEATCPQESEQHVPPRCRLRGLDLRSKVSPTTSAPAALASSPPLPSEYFHLLFPMAPRLSGSLVSSGLELKGFTFLESFLDSHVLHNPLIALDSLTHLIFPPIHFNQ